MIKYLRVECNEYHDSYKQDIFDVKEVSLEEIASMHSVSTLAQKRVLDTFQCYAKETGEWE